MQKVRTDKPANRSLQQLAQPLHYLQSRRLEMIILAGTLAILPTLGYAIFLLHLWKQEDHAEVQELSERFENSYKLHIKHYNQKRGFTNE